MGRPTTRKKRQTKVIDSSDEEASSAVTGAGASPKIQRSSATTKKTTQSKLGTPQSSKSTQSRRDALVSPASQTSPSSAKSKPKERTLYSFFNAQTQRQQTGPKSNGHVIKEDALADEADEVDAIEDDDSLDEAMAALDETSFGARYPAPMRRKRNINEAEGFESSSIPKGSQLFKRVSTDAARPTSTAPQADQRPWTEKFGPNNFDELAVHKKKVQDVRSWLQRVISGQERKRLLVLKGSAGAGKTVTVNLLAQELGVHVGEWRALGVTSSEEGFVSMSAQFQDFVARTGTFGTLQFEPTTRTTTTTTAPRPTHSTIQEAERKQLVLIEEFPNTFSRSSTGLQSFRSAVLQYLESSTPPLLGSMFAGIAASSKPIVPIVMIISESLLSTSTASSDSFTAYRLLGPDILGHHGTTVIEFNAIAPTFMTKALDTILQKESKKSGRRKAPGPAVLKHLAGIGDIRSAVSSLEFLCLRGDDSGDWSGRVTFTKKKSNVDAPMSVMEAKSLQMVTQRESTLGIFHAVGKVVYNKRETPTATDTPPPQPPNHLPQHARPKVSEVNIETLLNELGTDISTFIAALHENYILSCNGIDGEETLEHVNGCIDSLSDADILSPDRFGSNQFRQNYAGTGTDSLRQDEISFQASVRGMLFNLPYPVKRISPPQSSSTARNSAFGGRGTAFQMFYPASHRLWRRREEMEEALATVLAKVRNRTPSQKRSDPSKVSGVSAVEAWRLNRFAGQQPACSAQETSNLANSPDQADEELDAMTITMRASMAKGEMLLERLPYMSTMRRHNKLGDWRDLGKELDKITQMGGGASTAGGGDEEADEAEGATEGAEQWSTDRPTEDASATPKKKVFGLRKDSKKSEVVKQKVESLVLEDDDIVDD